MCYSMRSEFFVATEKGDKNLALLLRSAARRLWRPLALSGLAAALVVTVARAARGGGVAALRPVTRNISNNVTLRPPGDRPDRDAWRALSRAEMKRRLRCAHWLGQERPIHDDAVWAGMREAYVAIVGAEASTLAPAPDADASTDDAPAALATAFTSPVEVRQSPGKGRGIFALRAVPKGATLYDFSQSGQFRQAADFAEFLRVLRPDLACDVLMWSYVYDFSTGAGGEDGGAAPADLRMVTDLDAGSFCNDGGQGRGNTGWLDAAGERLATRRDHPWPVAIAGPDGAVRRDAVRSPPLVAVRDIAAGEELYCVYDQFSEATGRFMK